VTYQPKHLKRWTLPRDYAGEHWPEWYVFLGQHRDSDSVTRSTFATGLKSWGGETETVNVIREGHWAVGWVEWVGIHESDETALRAADAMAERIEGYPLLDESHHSELEWDEACEFWAGMSVRNRLELCQRFGLSGFAARHDYIPEDPGGRLFEYLTTP